MSKEISLKSIHEMCVGLSPGKMCPLLSWATNQDNRKSLKFSELRFLMEVKYTLRLSLSAKKPWPPSMEQSRLQQRAEAEKWLNANVFDKQVIKPYQVILSRAVGVSGATQAVAEIVSETAL